MEHEAEKMAALKKAYADIILNTAKESAARILASERKALRFQQSLFAAKEEALATLLRLKSLMDSKAKEAEKTSLGQVRRIQELEVQLCEAEDTIGHLREELKRVNQELEKMKNNLVEPLNEQNTNGHATSYNGICQESVLSSDSKLCSLVGPGNLSPLYIVNTTFSQKAKDSHYCFTENATHAESLKDLSTEKVCASNPDLASIIMRSKEPELYRNGCTQRIRAFEHNVLTVKVPLEQSDGQLPDFNNEPNVSENDKLERLHTADSAKIVRMVTQEAKKPTESEEIVQRASSSENGHAVKFFCRLSPRKQRARCNQMKSTNCATSPDQDMRSREPSVEIEGSKISGQEDSMIESGVTLIKKSISEEPPHKIQNSRSAPVSAVSCRSTEDNRIGSNKSFSNENSGLLQCNKRTVTRQNVMKQCHLDSKKEISQSPPYSTEEYIDHGKSIGDPILLRTTEMKDGILSTGGVQNDAGNLLHVDDSKLTIADQNVAESLDISDMTDDIPVTHSDNKYETTCKSSGTLGQAGTDKFLKYTFRRTRKRGSSSSNNESIFPEKKITAKRKSGDKQNALLEPQKPSLVTELPRNNRRLVQVARQVAVYFGLKNGGQEKARLRRKLANPPPS